MSDDVDRATERMEVEARYAIANSRRPAGPAPSGACHFCGETVADPKLFCDTDCRADWEREQQARRANGRREG